MAEILSREKELFKINQELNMLSLKPNEDLGHLANESRYGTYLKQKGPSTLLKKKNNIESPSRAVGRGLKARSVKSPNKSTATTTPTPPTVSPLPGSPRGKGIPAMTKTKMPDWRQGCDWKQSRAPTRIDSTFTRRSSQKTATYVKYRNPNFTQSPSLDLLLRNDKNVDVPQEQQQLQQQQQQQEIVQVEVTQKTRESTTVVNGQSKKQLTQDNFIRFLKAKVAILEEDHGQLTQDIADQKQRLDETYDALRLAETQRDQAISSNTRLSEQLHRLEQQTDEVNRRQKESLVEQSSQQRELEMLKRDIKLLKQTNTNLETRLLRANDEAEAARQMFSQKNEQQREEQVLQRKEFKLRDVRIKALKRQRADLLNAYKKQLFMIDNLKRQNACVEQAVSIGFGEKEFNKVLEWNTNNKTVY